jgi:hypothetical protein
VGRERSEAETNREKRAGSGKENEIFSKRVETERFAERSD